MVLHNPPMVDPVLRAVKRPARGRVVQVRQGCTHHGGGAPRALDLVCSIGDVELEVVIHNSIDCGGSQACGRPDCVHHARGDHVLSEVAIAMR